MEICKECRRPILYPGDLDKDIGLVYEKILADKDFIDLVKKKAEVRLNETLQTSYNNHP